MTELKEARSRKCPSLFFLVTRIQSCVRHKVLSSASTSGNPVTPQPTHHHPKFGWGEGKGECLISLQAEWPVYLRCIYHAFPLFSLRIHDMGCHWGEPHICLDGRNVVFGNLGKTSQDNIFRSRFSSLLPLVPIPLPFISTGFWKCHGLKRSHCPGLSVSLPGLVSTSGWVSGAFGRRNQCMDCSRHTHTYLI